MKGLTSKELERLFAGFEKESMAKSLGEGRYVGFVRYVTPWIEQPEKHECRCETCDERT